MQWSERREGEADQCSVHWSAKNSVQRKNCVCALPKTWDTLTACTRVSALFAYRQMREKERKKRFIAVFSSLLLTLITFPFSFFFVAILIHLCYCIACPIDTVHQSVLVRIAADAAVVAAAVRLQLPLFFVSPGTSNEFHFSVPFLIIKVPALSAYTDSKKKRVKRVEGIKWAHKLVHHYRRTNYYCQTTADQKREPPPTEQNCRRRCNSYTENLKEKEKQMRKKKKKAEILLLKSNCLQRGAEKKARQKRQVTKERREGGKGGKAIQSGKGKDTVGTHRKGLTKQKRQ